MDGVRTLIDPRPYNRAPPIARGRTLRFVIALAITPHLTEYQSRGRGSWEEEEEEEEEGGGEGEEEEEEEQKKKNEHRAANFKVSSCSKLLAFASAPLRPLPRSDDWVKLKSAV